MAFIIATVIMCLIATHSPTEAQNYDINYNVNYDVKSVSASIDAFSLKLLALTSDLIEIRNLNLALSPYTIWSLLSIVHEGAQNDTARQLEDVLGIPSCPGCLDQFRENYRAIENHISSNSEGVELNPASGIFISKNEVLNASFEEVARNVYSVNVMPIDFSDKRQAAKFINQYLSNVTNKRITGFINAGDLQGAEIFMTSALYFKGYWKAPFNKSATRKMIFYDEQNIPIGEVDMMFQKGVIPFAVVLDSKAFATELTYGNGDRTSMIVILPRRGETLSGVLRLLAATPVSTILDTITAASKKYVEEDIKVYIPRFRIKSDFFMNAILDKMGVKDIFKSDRANFSGISPNNKLYVSRILQRAYIEVDEEGTTAAAAGGATFNNKNPPPEFVANKPFAYLIVDKPTQTILFAGAVRNPNLN